MGFSVASLLMKLRPGEKRQRGRWRPGWRYQKGPGRGFLFRLAKMGQDPVDDVLTVRATRCSVAWLLVERCGCGFASCETRQCLGRCPGTWRQVRQGRAALLLLARMSQDSVDNVPVLNTGDDLYRSTAMSANLDIDIEYSLEPLGPGHCGMTVG
jgi:hypothetical protein